jgi:tol-pal system protein YbgF
MFRSIFRLTAAPAIAALVVMAPCAASAQGFLNDLFGNSDRFSPPSGSAQARPQRQPAQEPQQYPQEQAGPQGRVAQGPGEELSRIGRLEAQIRELTGTIEQLQHRNQQLESQLQRMRAGDGAVRVPLTQQQPQGGQPQVQPQARPQMQPQIQPQAQQSAPPPPAAGRRGEGVFDPAQHPNAPGAPRVLGTIPSTTSPYGPPGGVAQSQPQPNPNFEDDEVGAPGGRQAGAPLDLSTMAAGIPNDRATSQPGAVASEPPQAPPSPRTPGGAGGAQVATLPPSDSPRDNYDLAYGYIARKDYALAEDGFRNFLRRFPSDRLVPEAQYWLGESMFQRQRYRDAAEAFLAVSTKYEANARAPDALLRLGQSLAQMGEREAACASLAEVLRKYPRASVAVRQGVDREQKRVRC